MDVFQGDAVFEGDLLPGYEGTLPEPLTRAAAAASKRRRGEALERAKRSQGAGAKAESLGDDALLAAQLVLDVTDAMEFLREANCCGTLLRDVIKRFLDACLSGRCEFPLCCCEFSPYCGLSYMLSEGAALGVWASILA